MTEPVEKASSQAAAGQLLRQAREAAGIHIAALAVALKVPPKRLEALEAGRFDELPDQTFARALAASMCRHLKIDPAPVLERLPSARNQELAGSESHIGTRFSRTPGSGAAVASSVPRGVWLAAAALVLAGLGLVFWPQIQVYLPASRSAEAVAPPSAPNLTTFPAEDRGGQAVEPASAPASMAEAPSATLPALAPAVAPIPEAAPATPVAPTAADPAGGLLGITAKGSTWVEVKDAKGVSMIRRQLEAGERVNLDGKLPLSVTIGRADAAEVKVRGEAFGLAPHSRDNVARFKVQ